MLVVALLSSRKIFFVTADLGRHLTNGRLFPSTRELLETNFYSYTQPDFPFMNHHWGSGVIFNSVFSSFGYSGLTILNTLTLTLAFAILLYFARELAGPRPAALAALACMPLITARTEVRPEVFSYLFSASFYLVLGLVHTQKISRKSLYLLPLLMLVWVNLHIYFVLGYVLFGLYLLDGIFQKLPRPYFKDLLRAFVLTVLVALCNPVGWKLALYPLQIFKDYAYLVAENQSVAFFWRYPMHIAGFETFHLIAFLLIVSGIAAFKRPSTVCWPALAFTFFLLGLGSLAIRNFALLGLFAFPVLAGTMRELSKKQGIAWLILLIGGSLGTVVQWYKSRDSIKFQFGTGLYPGVNNAAEFFKAEKIRGPIFNNYDIGGYLIFHLFPEERVFVDNRPEAYSGDFFREIYAPMQESKATWQRALDRFGFNTIFFFRHDNTPAGQKFLVDRVRDPEWRAVYVDDYSIIMVRALAANQSLIDKYALPPEMFIVK